jgi:hypothetical protein
MMANLLFSLFLSQLGGVFVVTQDDGLLYESCSFYAGDLVSFDPVLKVCLVDFRADSLSLSLTLVKCLFLFF